MGKLKSVEELFEGRHFDREVIILCVRWYLRFKLSLRDLVEMISLEGQPSVDLGDRACKQEGSKRVRVGHLRIKAPELAQNVALVCERHLEPVVVHHDLPSVRRSALLLI